MKDKKADMEKDGSYEHYALSVMETYYEKDEKEIDLLVSSLKDKKVGFVLDIGCGAGQEMLPFVRKKGAFCVGIDVGEELGLIGKNLAENEKCREKLVFARSVGEELPFVDNSFDVVLCRIAITLMNNQKVIAEVSRVLRPEGVFLLKTHSPLFYLGMVKERLKTLSPKQVLYPLISLAGGTYQIITGNYPDIDFWKGREVFQTRSSLERELKKHHMEIKSYLPDTNSQAPSYYIEKV